MHPSGIVHETENFYSFVSFSAGRRHDGVILFFILFILLEIPSKTSATDVPVSLFIDPTIQNADSIFNQAKEEVLQFAPNVTLQNVVYQSPQCGNTETDTKEIFTYFQNYHSQNHRITMGPVCSANFLRFANLSAEIQALQINILKGYPYEHPTMIDMVTRSPQNLGENLVTILKEFEWAQVGAVLCEECYSDDQLASETYFDAIGRVLETNNIAVRELLKVKRGDNSQNISQSIKVFESSARVLLLFLGNSLNDYSQFLTAMRLNNYTTDEYTPVIILSKSSLELSFPWQNDPSTADLFDKTFIVSSEY
uniref:Guanylate cyclase n=1 Tax=Caenorhabditis tropicalis TaxID=1561998 RepID=A0A1I7T5G3_9PELO